jgi:hypothetical protein
MTQLTIIGSTGSVGFHGLANEWMLAVHTIKKPSASTNLLPYENKVLRGFARSHLRREDAEVEAEAEQRRRDRRHWKVKLEKLTTEIGREPERVRRSYTVAADRLETIGLVYLWPETN